MVNLEYYDYLVKRLNDFHRGTATGFNPDKRYAGPFFQKGSLFHKMTKDYKGTKLKGKTNTSGRSGSANYLIQTNPKFITDEDVNKKFGVKPESVIDVQSLAGDSTDNVPGVPGIGIKTAAELINQYGNLENLLKKFKNTLLLKK